MSKFTRLASISILVIVTLFAITNFAPTAQANSADVATPTPIGTPVADPGNDGEAVSVEEQEALKAVIQSYFELRYQALSALQPSGFQLDSFGDVASSEADAQAFLDAELSKLELQIKYAKLNWSRYVSYKYFLDFSSFTTDPATQLVTVTVLESNEIVHEISARSKSANPHVAKMSGLKHTIALRQEKEQWKIVSDSYNDFLWMTMREQGKSADEILSTLNTMEARSMPDVRHESAQIEALSPLPDDPSSHEYNREEAAYYAFTHGAYGFYNPNYPSYDDGEHGDCTNFVSQALYEGGNVSMYIPDPLPQPNLKGQPGWYLLNDMERATDWNYVNGFYNFVTNRSQAITEGPEGQVFDDVPEGDWPAGLMVGDVIQYNKENDDEWDHSAIVVSFDPETGDPLVASHSPNYPSINFNVVVQHVKTRFIHIERSDGYPPVKVQITSAIDDAGEFPLGSSCAITNTVSLERIYLGSCFNGEDITGGFQFRNVQIPRFAKIKYAYVTFTTDGPYTADSEDPLPGFYYPIQLEIRAEDTGVPADFSDTDPPAYRDNLTWSMVSWNINEMTNELYKLTNRWEFLGKRTTPDIKDIIRSITMLEDWVPGNKISLIFKNGLNATYPRRTVSFEALHESELIPARLIVAYDIVPFVSSVTVANTSPGYAHFMVAFSEPVTGVGVNDFKLTTNVPGAAISDVNGSGVMYTVTVSTGSGGGTIRLDVLDDDTIVNVDSRSLDGEFTSGVPYVIRIVTKLTDTDDGVCDTDCSLREAIAAAIPGDTIVFDAALSGGTIYLDAGTSTLLLSKDIVIDGSALAVPITISGDTNNDGVGDIRVFHVNAGVTVALCHLTISKGDDSNNGGGIYNEGVLAISDVIFSNNSALSGGMIYNLGTLTVMDSSFLGVNASSGGGIYNAGTSTVTNSTFSGGNSYFGGGIYNENILTVANSTFSGITVSSGSGIYNNGGIIEVANSTFAGNSAYSGGGIHSNGGEVTVINSTFAGNSVYSGGGIHNDGEVTVINSTFSDNSAPQGGGIFNSGTLNYSNTIIANSISGENCVNNGLIGANIANLVEDGSCSASLSGDPRLAPLADNGGPTQTFALLLGSPALSSGDDAVCAATPVNNVDQRGRTRPQGLHCDIGAFESWLEVQWPDNAATVSLLHMNGVDASTTFTDETGKPWTAVGNTQIDTAQYKFGGASAVFDGAGDYLTTPDHDNFYLSNENWTIDFWVRFDLAGGAKNLVSQYQDANNWMDVWLGADWTRLNFCQVSNRVATAQFYTDAHFSTDTWYHIAIMRNGDTPLIAIDGEQQTVIQVKSIAGKSFANLSGPLVIGAWNASGFLDGSIDEFRFSKGTARWTDDFTPPTSEYVLIPPPGAATLLSPSGNIAEINPTYTWNEVPGATWYYVWVDGPSGNVIKQWYTAVDANCDGTACSITSSTTLSSGAYTWRVRTWNDEGYGPWSAWMTFSPIAPGKASLILPSGNIVRTTPTYTWNEVPNATWYYLWVNGPSGNVIKQWYTATEANCNGAICSIAPPTTLSSGAHTWWIQTWNSVAAGSWSDPLNFSVIE